MTAFNKLYPFRHAPSGNALLNQNDRYIRGAIETTGEFSEDEVDMFRDILTKEDIVVEVGANMGAHTLALASLARGVIAFEPQRLIFQILCANLAINSITNVAALPMAVGATQGAILVPVPSPTHEDSNYGGLSLVDADSGETAQLTTLDAFNLSGVALLKLDCEGMELDVLKGAKELLRTNLPWVYMEFTSNRKALIDFFAELGGWRLYRHFPQHLRTPNFLETAELPEGLQFASDMVLACPPGRQPREAMEKGFGERHHLIEPSTEDLFGKAVPSLIWEPYVRAN